MQTTRRSASEEDLKAFIARKLPKQSAPISLRMAFHDAASFDPEDLTGGATGSIHFSNELARSENSSFVGMVECMKATKERFPEVSWADMIAAAGAVAVAMCGGPEIEVGLGRVDAEGPDPSYFLPKESTPMAVIKEEFAQWGFGPHELVALSGAHTLGGRTDGVSFTRDARTFSNSYFKRLVERDEDPSLTLLKTDRALMEDPELREHVVRYANDERSFQDDFVSAYVKMTWLGQVPTAG